MKVKTGFLSLLMVLLVSGIALAGDPMLDSISENPAVLIFAVLFNLVFITIMIVAQWKMFEKAGEPGWAAIVPIYNAVILLKIAGKPGWWIILMFVPFANIVVVILMDIGLARNFGRSDGFAVGLIFFPYIFLMILGFGDSQYSLVEQNI